MSREVKSGNKRGLHSDIIIYILGSRVFEILLQMLRGGGGLLFVNLLLSSLIPLHHLHVNQSKKFCICQYFNKSL